ncbi:hypothetical protein RXP93_29085, partial [Pseudomonas aeruginosa]|nr:hypothetical protein [Pseudomonas aeruginosa]
PGRVVAPATPPQPPRGSWLAGARRRGSLEGMAEFIYTMNKARKKVGDKVILDDVTMSFFPGAKPRSASWARTARASRPS